MKTARKPISLAEKMYVRGLVVKLFLQITKQNTWYEYNSPFMNSDKKALELFFCETANLTPSFDVYATIVLIGNETSYSYRHAINDKTLIRNPQS